MMNSSKGTWINSQVPISWALLLLMWATLGSNVCLGLSDAPPPQPVNDETHLFEETEVQILNTRLKEVQEKLGVRFYIAAVTFSNDKSARDMGARLARNWGQGLATIVLTHDRGKAQSAIAVSAEFWSRYPADAVVQVADLAAAPLRQADLSPTQKILAAVDAIIPRLTQVETARLKRQQSFTRTEMRLGLALSMALLGILLVGALVLALSRRREITKPKEHLFPKIEVSQRLGAPYGGGVMGESGR